MKIKEIQYNFLWDLDDDKSFRSKILGKPIYDMKCNQCLTFIGVYHKPEDCKDNYCLNCGNKIKQPLFHFQII